MDESKIIESYNEGVSEITSMMKELNFGLTNQVSGLNQEIKVLREEIKELREENLKLLARNAELEAKSKKNSKNSSKPPSTDNHKKPSNSRVKTGKATGGQKGHEGKTLLKVEKPDNVEDIKVEYCKCGCCLSEVEGTVQTRQVFDVPKITINVTEYRTHEVICPKCNKVNKTEFPKTITQPVQYGENLQALMVYLTNYQLIPLERATKLITALTGQKVSQGTIVNVTKKLYKKLEEFETVLKEQLKKSDILHADETGMRYQGKTNWVHTASTENLTHYAIHEKRGTKAAVDIGILPEFTGTLVHDHWKPYYTFEDCTHAECNAHHLRTLKGIHENFSHEWAKDMLSLLVSVKRQVDVLKEAEATEMAGDDIKQYYLDFKNILVKGKDECLEKGSKVLSKKTGKPKKTDAQRLLERLEKYDIETLAFMFDFSIPFDNNLAERNIRMVKLRQKISGCFRGDDGGDWFCRIRSYASTCAKNGFDVLEAFSNALNGNAFIPDNL